MRVWCGGVPSIPLFSENKMKMTPWAELCSPERAVACCVLAFLVGCAGQIGPASPGTAGTGAGQGGAGTVGAGGSGMSSSGTGGSAGTGTGGTITTGTGGTTATGTGGTGPLFPNPPAFQPPVGMLRRLTRSQFRNAVRDIFGVEVDIAKLEPDSWNGHFAVIGAAAVVSSEQGVEQYQTAIENAVNAVFADATKRSQFLGCTPTGAMNDTCLRGVLQNLGLRAWRRPLIAAELDRLMAVSVKASTELGAAIEGARWATVALFISPNFLYRPELGATTNGTLRLTSYEIASRLSFLVWGSLPDKPLLDQAAGGMLGTADGIRSAATRLLDAPAGREAIGAFAEEYMRLDRIATQAKDAALFPEYGAPLQAAMARDMRGTWEAIAFDDRTSALSLFSTTKVLVNTELARLYGLDTTGLSSTTFQTRSLPADGPRVGILGKAGFLSQFANQKEGSPTLRGKFMREAFLCTTIPPPSGDIITVLEEPPPDMPMTKRQRLEQHRTNPSCNNCHGHMDPLGLPLETFDAIGRFRTTDHGLPIDPSGDFNGQAVADARALGQAASASAAVANCLVRRYYAYAVGHEERSADYSVLNTLADSFRASGYKLRELILDVVTNDAFTAVAPQP
jgi:hypothetical protein